MTNEQKSVADAFGQVVLDSCYDEARELIDREVANIEGNGGKKNFGQAFQEIGQFLQSDTTKLTVMEMFIKLVALSRFLRFAAEVSVLSSWQDFTEGKESTNG